MNRRDAPEPLHLRRAEIAYADRANFPRAPESVEYRGRLLDRNRLVRPVHLIDVDHIGAQTAQRSVELMPQTRGGGVAKRFAVAPVEADLRRDQRAPAAPAREC